MTINEPNVYGFGAYVDGDLPSRQKGYQFAALRVMVNLLRGHAMAYKVIHELQPEARVGLVHELPLHLAGQRIAAGQVGGGIPVAKCSTTCFPAQRMTGKLRLLYKTVKIPEAARTQDFLGVNYYTRDLVSFDLRHAGTVFAHRYYRPDAELSGTGFIAHEPDGFYEALKWGLQFNVPMLVTENGVEDADDKIRPRYIAEHIMKMWRAVNFNWPVKGYFHWSLVDNFEWERGWSQRFGLWGLDVDTQARIRRTVSGFLRRDLQGERIVLCDGGEVLP